MFCEEEAMKNKKVFVVGDHCFVPHPGGEQDHWMRVRRCVAFVRCPSCHAKRGVPCSDHGAKIAWVHADRGMIYRRIRDENLIKAKRISYVIVEEFDGEVDV